MLFRERFWQSLESPHNGDAVTAVTGQPIYEAKQYEYGILYGLHGFDCPSICPGCGHRPHHHMTWRHVWRHIMSCHTWRHSAQWRSVNYGTGCCERYYNRILAVMRTTSWRLSTSQVSMFLHTLSVCLGGQLVVIAGQNATRHAWFYGRAIK